MSAVIQCERPWGLVGLLSIVVCSKLVLTTALTLALIGPCAGAPRVANVVPPDGAKAVRTSSNIRVDFDTVMDASSITTTTVLLDGKPLSEIPGAAVVHPTGTSSVILLKLAPNNGYRFTLTTGIRDSNGQALTEPYTWEFVTASRVDNPDNPLLVLARYPRLNEFGVPTNAPVTVTFTTELSPESFGPHSVLVRGLPGGSPVPGKVSVKGKRVVFRPDAPLSANHPYEAAISGESRSRRETISSEQTSWRFTTGDGPSDGVVIADAWIESYISADERRFVFHAAIERLGKSGAAASGSQALASGPRQEPAFVVKAAVASLAELLPGQPVKNAATRITDAAAMPVSNGSPPVRIDSAYTQSRGSIQGNSVGAASGESFRSRYDALVRDALANASAVVMRDSGDLAGCGDADQNDGVYSGRMSLSAGFPGGQACAAFTIVPDGAEPSKPVTIPVYVNPSARDAGNPASAGNLQEENQ